MCTIFIFLQVKTDHCVDVKHVNLNPWCAVTSPRPPASFVLQPHNRRLVVGSVHAAAGVGAVWKVKSCRDVANAKPETRKLTTLTVMVLNVLTTVRYIH